MSKRMNGSNRITSGTAVSVVAPGSETGETPVPPTPVPRTPAGPSRQTKLRRLSAVAAVASIAVLGAAVAPARAQTILNQVAKLLADDGAQSDNFGFSVALSVDTAVVGARWDDSNTGSAYVFTHDAGGVWSQQAKLLADDGAMFDEFGFSVALSGDTAVIGAQKDDDNGTSSGSAYAFVRDAGVWTQQAKLLPSDGAEGDLFGLAVAISGDTAVAGAPGDDDNGTDSGSAYVFVRDAGGVWTQQAKLLPDFGVSGRLFGVSVAISGDTAIIGQAGGVNAAGSAVVFTRDAGGVWTQQIKLLASDGATGDQFGFSVGIISDTALVGARGDDSATGSAYVFTRDPVGVWSQQAKLLADDGGVGDNFGWDVAIHGDTAVVGAWLNNDNGPNSGSAYAFVRDGGGVWTQLIKLLPDDGAVSDQFGRSVAVNGAVALIGTPFDDDNNATNSGSAYVFDLPSQGNPADLNGDGVVDGADLASLLTQWGTNGAADLNGDGTVDGADLAALLTNWGPV